MLGFGFGCLCVMGALSMDIVGLFDRLIICM